MIWGQFIFARGMDFEIIPDSIRKEADSIRARALRGAPKQNRPKRRAKTKPPQEARKTKSQGKRRTKTKNRAGGRSGQSDHYT